MNHIIIKLAKAEDAKLFMNQFNKRIRVTMNDKQRVVVNTTEVTEEDLEQLIFDAGVSCTMYIYNMTPGKTNRSNVYIDGRPREYKLYELIEDADDLDFALGLLSEKEYAKAKGFLSWA